MSPIEQMAQAEFREGVSAGAAARQLIALLGASGYAPTLKRMLEEMLSASNRKSFDRSCILRRFEEASPDAAAAARMESFDRINRRAA